jgi:hypothetical protein
MKDTANIYESMTVDELERRLPLYVQKEGETICPCPRCRQDSSECRQTYTFRQQIYRNGEEKHRIYDISYRRDEFPNDTLFRTDRYTSLKAALIEAHETLIKLGLHPYAEEADANGTE